MGITGNTTLDLMQVLKSSLHDENPKVYNEKSNFKVKGFCRSCIKY